MYHQPKTDEQTGAKRRQRTSVRAVSPRGQGRHELGLPCRSESPVHCQRRLDYINGQMGQNQALDQSRDLVLENGSVVRRGPVTIVVRRVGSTDAGNSGANQTGPHRCGHRGRRYPTWLGEPMRLRCHAVARRCRGDLLRRHSRVALRRFGLVGWPAHARWLWRSLLVPIFGLAIMMAGLYQRFETAASWWLLTGGIWLTLISCVLWGAASCIVAGLGWCSYIRRRLTKQMGGPLRQPNQSAARRTMGWTCGLEMV